MIPPATKAYNTCSRSAIPRSNDEAARRRAASKVRVDEGLVLDRAVDRLAAGLEHALRVGGVVNAGDLKLVERGIELRLQRRRVAGLVVENRAEGEKRRAAGWAAVRRRVVRSADGRGDRPL